MTDAAAVPAIQVSALTKSYKGQLALDHVDLTVPQGSVFGFLGPNGAGKTTTLRLLNGLAVPTSGEARILGQQVTRGLDRNRASVGYLPDVPGFYPWMTAREFLLFAGGLFGLRGEVLDQRVSSLLDLAGLTEVTSRVGGYSRGMKQRLGIAQALINAPKVLLLDEPTSALDPIGRKDVLEMIAALAGRTTVFFSTHILSDVERVCDTVAVLDHGRVLVQAPMAELKRQHGAQRLIVEVSTDSAQLAEEFAAASWCHELVRRADGALVMTVDDVAAAQVDVPARIAAHGLGLVRMETPEMGLEEVFVDLVGGTN